MESKGMDFGEMEIKSTEFVFRCPSCLGYGVIDQEQRDSKVSIICAFCNWHGYKRDADSQK